MSRNGQNGVPAYQRIQSSIRERIDAGELKPGARHALAGLESEGMVERRRGAGTFVAPPRIHFNKLMSYTEQMSSRGLAPSSKIIASKIIQDEDEIAARLNLPAASRMVKIERVRHTSEEPFALETCYLPADEFPGLVRSPLGRSSLFATLERDYGVEITYADEEVDATTADARVAQLLEVPRSSSVLRIRQVIHSSNGKAIVYVIGLYRSERHSLFIRRYR